MTSEVDSTSAMETVGDEDADSVFIAWERLRIVYNFVLVLVVLPFATRLFNDRKFLGFLIQASIGANLCFCVGPVAEGYLALLGANRRVARWWIFIPGLLFASLLALAVLIFPLHMD